MSELTAPLPQSHPDGRPALDRETAARVAREVFAVKGRVEALPSYRDQNFRIGDAWVLKVAHQEVDRVVLDAEQAAMDHLRERLPDLGFPHVALDGEGRPRLAHLPQDNGGGHWVRLCHWVDGTPLSRCPAQDRAGLERIGATVGSVAEALRSFEHAGARRALSWDLARAPSVVAEHLRHVGDPLARVDIARVLGEYRERYAPLISELDRSVVHNDLNTDNLLVASEMQADQVTGILDFGDLVESVRIAELAIAATYLMLDTSDPLAAVAAVARGYHSVVPLTDLEVELLLPLIRMRLLVSRVMAAMASAQREQAAYVHTSQPGVVAALSTLSVLDDHRATGRLFDELGTSRRPVLAPQPTGSAEIRAARARTLGHALSLSYRTPLHIVRGRGAYLFEANGTAYLDCVNNVAHVGHEHPWVVEALRTQAARLNTNTRYLHGLRPAYAERLLSLFPERFETCYLVCSGSEANELALRMARAASGGHAMVVLQGGYHGNTNSLVGLSSYKYDGKGGSGRPDWVEEAPTPDPYRGVLSGGEQQGAGYAALVADAADRASHTRGALAGYIAESIMSCAGQIVPPEGFLRQSMAEVQARGGLAISDEVQVGFGRVGEAWWGFELDGALPDIVTLGKPIGNGHPLGAVVTTRVVAEAFANGMEYFNSFGGNPVSCAVGLAVLDVLEQQGLREHALQVGGDLLTQLEDLAERDERVGEARGRGLFLGVELVSDAETRWPHPELAREIAERLRERDHILVSVDGPQENVIKIKPPLAFSSGDAGRLLRALEAALADL